jgi:uncharacterized membrane protein YkoI
MKKPSTAVTAAFLGSVLGVVTTLVATNVFFGSDDSQVVETVVVRPDPVSETAQTESVQPEPLRSASVTTVATPSAQSVDVGTSSDAQAIVPGLATVKGTLEMRGDEFYLGNREVDLGPDEWIVTTSAPADLNGNGTVESVWSEVLGLLGRQVTLLGETDDGDIDVYEINGVILRPSYSSVAPWSGERTSRNTPGGLAGTLKNGITAEEATRIALQVVPGVVTRARVDIDDRRPYWELDVTGTDGFRYDIEIDAVSGKVVDIDRD